MCDGRVLFGYPLEFSDICFIYPPTYDDIVRKGYDKSKGFGISQIKKSVLLYNRPKGKDKKQKGGKTNEES